jgi:hypothetical protein
MSPTRTEWEDGSRRLRRSQSRRGLKRIAQRNWSTARTVLIVSAVLILLMIAQFVARQDRDQREDEDSIDVPSYSPPGIGATR